MSEFPRRQFLITGTAAAAALALENTFAGSLRAEAPARALGIQLYTVAADLGKDVPGTLKALSSIGYKNVETAGFGKLSAVDFRKAIDDAGLRCPSAHLRLTADDPGSLFEDAHALGAHYAVSSVLVATSEQAPQPGVGQKEAAQAFVKNLSNLTLDDFKRTAELANSIGAKAKAAGLQYAYHNHNFEFKDQGNGQIGYDVLLSQTDPDLVKFELDCGWMVAAGHDPFARGLDTGDEWRGRGIGKTRQRRGCLMREPLRGKLGMSDRDFLKILDTPQIAVHADGPQIKRGDAEGLRSDFAVPAVKSPEIQIRRSIRQTSSLDRVGVVHQKQEHVAVAGVQRRGVLGDVH